MPDPGADAAQTERGYRPYGEQHRTIQQRLGAAATVLASVRHDNGHDPQRWPVRDRLDYAAAESALIAAQILAAAHAGVVHDLNQA